MSTHYEPVVTHDEVTCKHCGTGGLRWELQPSRHGGAHHVLTDERGAHHHCPASAEDFEDLDHA
ncbi:MAG: hypothetical protein U5L08_04510 [Xanthomonadales bacterium]|nr:hypothetical protein [Xanthomonadales bacterium]